LWLHYLQQSSTREQMPQAACRSSVVYHDADVTPALLPSPVTHNVQDHAQSNLFMAHIKLRIMSNNPFLRSLHRLKVTECNLRSCHLLTKFCRPTNFHICITSSPFSLLAALFHLLSLSLIH